jgi:hypothetical protein
VDLVLDGLPRGGWLGWDKVGNGLDILGYCKVILFYLDWLSLLDKRIWVKWLLGRCQELGLGQNNNNTFLLKLGRGVGKHC